MPPPSEPSVQSTLSGDPAPPPEGYIQDFITKQWVKDSPEEREAVQVFARRLIQELNYPPALITTRPQFRVKISPSGTPKYPVDIAVFTSATKLYGECYIIVECKKPTRKEGEEQLIQYLNLCPSAQIGIWFNGQEHLYLKRVVTSSGVSKYPEFFSLPRYGQTLTSVGEIRRKDLKNPINLKTTFKDIRNYLAGNATGITRDEQFAKEIINLLFCKIKDETDIHKGPDDFMDFHANDGEPPSAVKARIVKYFKNEVKLEYEDVFDDSDRITLDDESLTYVVGELQGYALVDAEREAIGELFEVFIGPAIRGKEGQFFTPRNVVKMMIRDS